MAKIDRITSVLRTVTVRATTFLWFIFAVAVCVIAHPSVSSAQNRDEAAKRILYQQIMRDSFIHQLLDDVRKDPRNQTKIDRLLIQLPLSPMDLFRIRMETNKLEYVIPKEVFSIHRRWLVLRPPVQSASRAMQALLLLEPSTSLLASAVETNRNVASTYSPAPNEYQGEVQIAVNRNDTNQIIIGANTWDAPSGCDQTQAIFSSIDGGTTWRYTCAPRADDYAVYCADFEALKFGSDPAAYWDNNGNAFLNHIAICCDIFCQFGFTYPTTALVVAKSTDAGLNWSPFGVVANHIQTYDGTIPEIDDKQFYIIDTNPSSPYYNRHYECWDYNNDQLVAYSVDGGATWTQRDLPSAGPGLFDINCDLAIESNGTVHVAWDALTCGLTTCSDEATYYTRSTDGGNSWSAPVLINDHNIYGFSDAAKIPPQDSRGIMPFGAIDVDNSTAHPGRLYFAFSDVPNGASMSTSDIYVARSDDGTTWTAVKVNDDSTNTAQFHPFLVVDQTDGTVVVGWHDARNDPANNRKVDYYMSRSTDGGVTWEANTKVSQPSSEFNNNSISYSDENTTDNFNANPNQYGEYLGVDAHNGKAYMAWTDSRHFYPGSTSNAQVENIGFAAVTFSGSGSDTTPPTTSITSPTEGSTVSGTIQIAADASDDVAVTNVEFYLDGGTLLGTDTASPYTFSWDTTGATNGSHSLTTKAYDAANNVGTSAAVNITVDNPDVTAPTTSITSPTEGSTVSGTIPIAADADDDVGVTKVEFYLDGGTLLGTDTTSTTSPYSINWDTTGATNASHSLTTKAYDAMNNVGTSAAVNITVSNGGGCTEPSGLSSTAADADPCGDTGVDLSWTAPGGGWGDGGSGSRTYDVLRDGIAIATLPEATTTYNDNTGTNGINYTYSIGYNNGCGSSATTAGEQAADQVASSGGSETALQVVSPIQAKNSIASSDLSSAFSIAAASASAADISWTLSGNTNLNSCTEVRLRAPNATELTLKAAGQSNPGTADVLSFYKTYGPGTYTIVLEELGACERNNRNANLSNTQMTVQSAGSCGGNTFPIASFSYSCNDLTCNFFDASSDPDGSIVTRDWDFGDGTAHSPATNPQHTYASASTYTVTLTVTDNGGANANDVQNVTVTEGGGFTLTTSGYKDKGIQHATLNWSGASGTDVDIFRNGALITPLHTPNDGNYDDNIGVKGGGISYTYKVCEAGSTTTCSNDSVVVF